jgi:hypothetical protein
MNEEVGAYRRREADAIYHHLRESALPTDEFLLGYCPAAPTSSRSSVGATSATAPRTLGVPQHETRTSATYATAPPTNGLTIRWGKGSITMFVVA